MQKLNAAQEYPGSRTSQSSAHYGAGKKGLLEQKAKLQELFDSVLYRSMTGGKVIKVCRGEVVGETS